MPPTPSGAAPTSPQDPGEDRVRRPPPPARRSVRSRKAGTAIAGLAVAALLALPQTHTSPADAQGPSGSPPRVGLVSAAASPSEDWPAPPSTAGSTSSSRQSQVPGVRLVSALTSGGIPATAFTAYTRAAATAPATCHVGWSLIAAIGRVESDHGRFAGAILGADGLSTPPIIGLPLNGVGTALVPDTDHGSLDGDPVYDHAVGPMQFIPSTWAGYAGDGNADGRSDPFNIYDAATAAARYLCAAGGDLGSEAGQARAVFAYNHSDSYVAMVLTLAATYAGGPPPTLAPLPLAPPTLPPANPAVPPAIAAAPTHDGAVPTTPTHTSSSSASSTAATSSSTSTSATSSAASSTTASTSTAASSTTSSTTSTTGTSTTSSPTTSTPSPTSCSAQATQETVDVVNETGDEAVGTDVAEHLTAAGIRVGTVSASTGSTASGIEYPAALLAQAQSLADALGTPDLLSEADVEHLTVVLRADDMGLLVAAVDNLPAATCGSATPTE